MPHSTLPIINISLSKGDQDAQKKKIASDIDNAACQYGFFYLTGYQIPEQLIADCFKAAEAFFDLPTTEKNKITIEKSPCHRGWYALGGEVLDPVHQREGDIKEGLKIGNDLPLNHPLVTNGIPLHGPNQWPQINFETMPTMDSVLWQKTMLTTYEYFCQTGLEVMQYFAMALNLKTDYFDYWLTRPQSEPMATLSPIRYPALDQAETALSAGSHTDFGCLTLLAQDDNEGLEIAMPDGTWLSVPPIENTLIVNIGDMLAFWSGGKYRSTLHKVSNRSGRTRHSLAFFYDPAYNTPLVNLRNDLAEQNEKGGVVQTALDHLLEKIGDSFSYQQK